jgi:hypothetical protein
MAVTVDICSGEITLFGFDEEKVSAKRHTDNARKRGRK